VWLAGSRGFTGVVSIFYLAVSARALGPEGFGTFTLVLTYAQLLSNLVQFQSWKGVIRYGARHLTEERSARLGRLFGFTATLDWAGALVGAAIAVAAVPIVARLLHWGPHEQGSAAVFAGVLLLTTGATPSGILRLFDRFDLLAYTGAVGPLIRFIGACLVWASGGGIRSFLVVWGLAAVVQTLAQWFAALRLRKFRLALGRRAFARALHENHRIWRFMIQTNLSGSLSTFWIQTGTLAVGAVVGPAEAGAFRLARRLAKGIGKPVDLITRALYPELSRLVAEDNHRELRHVLLRVTAVAAIIAIAMVLVVSFAGSAILRILVGRQFGFARELLILMAISVGIDLTGFALEPYHNARGKAGRILRIRVIGALVYGIALVVLLSWIGAAGAAFASIAASLIMFVQLAASTRQLLRRKR
jgi:O-antigen/teichoic acid export membrane protein